MAVTVRIPEALRSLTGGVGQIEVEGGTVREMLDALETRHPGIKERICDEAGQVRRFVNIFVNEEDIRFQENLETKLAAGVEVSILPAVAGGARGASKKTRGKAKAAKKNGPAVRRIYLTFDDDTVRRPIVYELIKKFQVVPNIRGASVTDQVGILTLEVSGAREELDKAFTWLRRQRVRVDPVEMNVVEP